MPPPLLDDEESYQSSEDSDFAPDANPSGLDEDSSTSDDDDDNDNDKPQRSNKPVTAATNVKGATKGKDDGVGYDNSGDEAIIKKGSRKRRKGQVHDDDEGGEGGLIKTRRQRAAE